MVTEPFAMPVTTPVEGFPVAKAVLLLLHVPAATSEVKVIVAAFPEHIVEAPVIIVGATPTFTDVTASEPQPVV